MEEPSFQPIITLYDAVTDSPVFRSSVYHYDQQLEHLEHWLDTFSRHLKQYTDKLSKFNTETLSLCQKAIPEGIDESLIDPNFTGAVMRSFSEALQTSLSFKAKLISSLEESLVSPLQQFVKTHLKDFKSFRKQHEKALEKYEAQLAKYNALHKTKEPSAVREEAYRLHEARKEYVRMSGQHVLRILNFRSLLEHCLVERFSAATVANKVFYDDIQVWAKLEVALSYWKQWLADDKFTCSHQLHKQQIARRKLEDEYFQLTAPDHEMGKQITTKPKRRMDSNFAKSKWGYLFMKTSRHSWNRKWFFIHNGYFGTCQVDHSNKRKGIITLENRIGIADSEINTPMEEDRRFCFEIKQTNTQTSFILQAETEAVMQSWIDMFNINSATQKSLPSSNSATAVPDMKQVNSLSSSYSNISAMTDTHEDSLGAIALKPYKSPLEKTSSIVMVSTTPDTGASLETSPSLTPLLIWEAARIPSANNNLPSDSWGIPWSLVPTMTNLMEDNHNVSDSALAFPQVIWPAQPAVIDVPKVDITGYTDKLNAQNRELRRLFVGVKPEEVVLDVFGCCLRSKCSHRNDIKEIASAKSDLNSLRADLYEKELVEQLSKDEWNPPSEFGYAYTGRCFITQDTFWFYSSVLMSSINTVAIPLKDIEEVKVIRDTSLVTTTNDFALSTKSDMVMSITLSSNEADPQGQVREPLILSTLLNDIDITAEKLRFAVNNAKSDEPMQLRNIFNKMQSLSATITPRKSLIFNLPNTFSDAVKPVEKNESTVVLSKTKRPHAATVGQESKVNAASIIKSANRQRGDSEPTRSSTPMDPKVEAPKPYVDPDMPPSHVQVPEGTIACECDDHLERQDAQIILPISAKRCYEMLFSDEKTAPPSDGGVWKEKTAAIEGHDLTVSKWEKTDGKMQRVLTYWMPVSNPIVRMKEAEVVETQVLINKEDYVRYTVQISTKTAALPYADAFIPSVRYCITRIDQSKCQLTCYLGVKWVKSVLVRAIVTRAALKGMADSVGVFVPILKANAEKIKQSLDKARHQHQTGPHGSHDSNHNMESLAEDEEELDQEDDFDSEGLVETAVPLPNTTETSSNISLGSSNKSPLSNVRSRSPLPESKINTSTTKVVRKGGAPASTTVHKKHRTKDMAPSPKHVWLTTVRDYIAASLVPIGSLVLFIFTMYMTWKWFRSGSRIVDEVTNYPRINGTVHHPMIKHTPRKKESSSRSVYLRDLQDGFLKNSLVPPYAGSESYKLFLETKNDSLNAITHEQVSNQIWYNVDHYRLAMDLDVSRERIAVLRHDMLVTFQVLNKVDAQLIENEYTNWLLDARLKCKYNPSLPKDDPRSKKSLVLCKDVKRQLDKLF